MSTTVSRAFTFEAAHRLTGVSETHKCSRTHGHNYRVVVMVHGPVDIHTGFVIDFFDIDRRVSPLLAQLDHGMLNDVSGLENPTAELIAEWVGRRVSIPNLASVAVYENPDCWAEWKP